MPRTKTITLYKFDELSERAKKKALETIRHDYEYAWQDEWQDTRKAFEKEFPIKVTNWSIGAYQHSSAKTEFNYDRALNLKGAELFAHLQREHTKVIKDPTSMTGYCGDYDILQPIADFVKKPDGEMDYETLLKSCVESWVDGYQKDMESQLEDEYLADYAIANEFEFTQTGERE